MRKVTLRVPEAQVEDLDSLVTRGRYPDRSEAIRDAIRRLTDRERATGGGVHRQTETRPTQPFEQWGDG